MIHTLLRSGDLSGLISGQGIKLHGEIVCKEIIKESAGEGRYLISDGEKDFFLRLTSVFQDYTEAADLNNYLVARGCQVIPILFAGEQIQVNGIVLRADLRPYFKGRQYSHSTEDLHATLAAIRKIHESLKTYPGAERIKQVAREKAERLEAVRKQLISGDKILLNQYTPDADILNELAALDVNLGLTENAQCLHGDLHYENVLFEPDGKAIIFDFEESSKVYLNEVYDLVYILDRFSLQQPEKLSPRNCYEALQKYYSLPRTFEEMLRLASGIYLRLILVVFDNHLQQKKELNTREIEKFILRFRGMRKMENELV